MATTAFGKSTPKKTVIKTPEQRAKMLPAPQKGKLVTVPVELLPFYMNIHHVKHHRFLGDVMVVKKIEGAS